MASSDMLDPHEYCTDDVSVSENRATASKHFRWSYLGLAGKGIHLGVVMTINRFVDGQFAQWNRMSSSFVQ